MILTFDNYGRPLTPMPLANVASANFVFTSYAGRLRLTLFGSAFSTCILLSNSHTHRSEFQGCWLSLLSAHSHNIKGAGVYSTFLIKLLSNQSELHYAPAFKHSHYLSNGNTNKNWTLI